MKKKIMILGASILQLPAIEQARRMGLQVVVVDMNPNAIGFDVEGIEKEVISTIDIPAILEAAKRHRIDGIMTLATDMPMQAVATVAKEMNLVGISLDTAIKATNKAEMRIALRDAGVPIPMFYRVTTKDEYKIAVQKIKDAGYKCIIKPVDNSGSRGIDLLRDYCPETIDRAYEYCKQSSRSGALMVEEFMDGDEVSVETLSVNGECHVIQITDKLTTGAPYFVEMGHSQPSEHSDKMKAKIAEIAIAANYAIGIENGPSHTEIKVTKDGPKVVELGARLGGDFITSDLVPFSIGVDMLAATIQIACGDEIDIARKFDKGSAIRFIEASEGVLKSVVGLEDAYNVPGIHRIEMFKQVGERIDKVKNSLDRVGCVIAQGDDARDAVKRCGEAIQKIKIEVE